MSADAGFDTAVPDGPEAAEHPHAPPLARPAPAHVDVTNDFGATLDDDVFVFVRGLEGEVAFNEAIRLAAWIVALADKAGIKHQFPDVVEAIGQIL